VSYSNSAAPISLANPYASAKAASGFALGWVNPNFKNAYIEDFNFNVQQALPWRMESSIGYYGSVGRHLLIVTNANQATGIPGSARPFTTLSAASPIAPGASIASNISERNSIGHSSYNAMWATLSKNAGNGLEFNVNYEYAKSLDINSLGSQGGAVLPDSTNPSENYGLSDFDVRHHFAGTAIYALPFKGSRLVSGYRLESIFQYQTGNPVNIVASSDGYNGNSGLIRPNLLGPIVRHKQIVPGSANVAYFPTPAGTVCTLATVTSACVYQIVETGAGVYTGLGNAQRNAGTGPGFADLDVSAEKQTKIFEGLSFTLRVDAFDILNHPNFGQPSSNVQSTSFGQITATRFATSDGGSSRQLQISGKFIF